MWKIGQTLAIGGLTYFFCEAVRETEGLEPGGVVVFFLMSMCIVAFTTACIVNMWDWLTRPIRRVMARGQRRMDAELLAARAALLETLRLANVGADPESRETPRQLDCFGAPLRSRGKGAEG